MSKYQLKQPRHFTEALRLEVVGLVESGKLSVAAASREYRVSDQSIYRWIHKYSTYNRKGAVLIVSKESQETTIRDLKSRIAELERTLGRKQMMLEFMESYAAELGKSVPDEVKKKLYSSAASNTGHAKAEDGP